MGLEPTTSELEVQSAIRCATAAMTLQEKQILRDLKGDFHHDITLSIKTNLETWKVKIQFTYLLSIYLRRLTVKSPHQVFILPIMH